MKGVNKGENRVLSKQSGENKKKSKTSDSRGLDVEDENDNLGYLYKQSQPLVNMKND